MTLVKLIKLRKKADYLKGLTYEMRREVYQNSQDLIVDFDPQYREEFQRQRRLFQARKVKQQMKILKESYEELNLVYQELDLLRDSKTVKIMLHIDKYGFHYIVVLAVILAYLI